jgi:hypothetical protein
MPIMAICLLAVLDMGLIVSPHGDSKIVVPCACGDCPNHSGCRVNPRPGTSDSPKTRNSSDRPSLPRMEPRLVKLLIYRPTADCEIGQIYVITSSKLGFGTRIVTIPTSVHDPARALILPDLTAEVVDHFSMHPPTAMPRRCGRAVAPPTSTPIPPTSAVGTDATYKPRADLAASSWHRGRLSMEDAKALKVTFAADRCDHRVGAEG